MAVDEVKVGGEGVQIVARQHLRDFAKPRRHLVEPLVQKEACRASGLAEHLRAMLGRNLDIAFEQPRQVDAAYSLQLMELVGQSPLPRALLEIGDEADDLRCALPGGIGDPFVVQVDPGRGRLGRRRRRRGRRGWLDQAQGLEQSLKDAFVRHAPVSRDQNAIDEASLAETGAAAAQIGGGNGAIVAQYLQGEQPVVQRGAGAAAGEQRRGRRIEEDEVGLLAGQ